MRLKGTGFFSDLMHTYIYLLATKIVTVLWRTFLHNAFLVDSELSYVIEKLFTISVFVVSFGLQRFKFGLWERLHLVTKTVFWKFLFSFSKLDMIRKLCFALQNVYLDNRALRYLGVICRPGRWQKFSVSASCICFTEVKRVLKNRYKVRCSGYDRGLKTRNIS